MASDHAICTKRYQDEGHPFPDKHFDLHFFLLLYHCIPSAIDEKSVVQGSCYSLSFWKDAIAARQAAGEEDICFPDNLGRSLHILTMRDFAWCVLFSNYLTAASHSVSNLQPTLLDYLHPAAGAELCCGDNTAVGASQQTGELRRSGVLLQSPKLRRTSASNAL